jgi:hypothetical protein
MGRGVNENIYFRVGQVPITWTDGFEIRRWNFVIGQTSGILNPRSPFHVGQRGPHSPVYLGESAPKSLHNSGRKER